jgi:multiple antibiotic resistance protein
VAIGVGTFTRVMALTVLALAPLINPAGVAPIFLSMTAGASDAARSRLALRIARHSCILLIAAMLAGSSILLLFGLTLAEIRIAGGLLVIATAWQLVHAEHGFDSTVMTVSVDDHLRSLAHRSFYPLTFPVTIGPGSLAVAVTLGAGVRNGDELDLASLIGTIAGCVLVSSTIYVCYRFASRAAKLLGTAGTLVVLRLSAFILLSIGVKILGDGLAARFATGSA